MNKFQEYFKNNKGKCISKWSNYLDVYDHYFKDYIGKDLVLLEIGVNNGGSLDMWRSYFGKGAKIYGIDVNEKCKTLESEGIEIFIGSQSDEKFLSSIIDKIPPIDIIIDDGGHMMSQQIISFKFLFDYLKKGGIYLCEDTHTSYWYMFGGGYRRNGTFIEFAKNIVDDIHAYHSVQKRFKQNKYTKTVSSIHFHDSIVVIKKDDHSKPQMIVSGVDELEVNLPPKSLVLEFLLKVINRILQFWRIKGFIWW